MVAGAALGEDAKDSRDVSGGAAVAGGGIHDGADDAG